MRRCAVPPLADSAGLALVDFGFVPHFDHSASQRAALRRIAAKLGGRAYGVPDGSAIVVDGSNVELLGPVVVA